MESCRYQQPVSSQQNSSSSIRVCPVGFRFIPEESHLVYYLQRKIANPKAQFPFILEKNIYDDIDCHPRDLLESHGKEGAVYILSPRFRRYGDRSRRETKYGTWKNSTREEPIMHGGVDIGNKARLVFIQSSDHKATHWSMWEYCMPKYQKKSEGQKPMDDLVICKIYSTKDPARQGKAPASRKRIEKPCSSAVKLPAKKLAQGGSCGLQEVELVSNNVHYREPQHAIAQVDSGQADYSHSQLSHYHNEVQNKEEEYDEEQYYRDCNFLINSDYFSDRNFQAAGSSSTSNILSMQKYSMEPPTSALRDPTFTHFNPGLNSTSTHSFYNSLENNTILSNYNGLQGGGYSGGSFGSNYNGLANNSTHSNFNGLQGGGCPGGGFDSFESGYELPLDKLVPGYILNTSFTTIYDNMTPVPGLAPFDQEYQKELPPY